VAQPLAVPCALNYSLLFSLPLSSGHVINGVTFFCHDSQLGSEGEVMLFERHKNQIFKSLCSLRMKEA
jgi:hypothetical protein